MTNSPEPSDASAVNGTASDEGEDQVIGHALRRSLICFCLVGLVVGAIVGWRHWPSAPVATQPAAIKLPQMRQRTKTEPPVLRFIDITREVGIDFVHHNGATGDKLLPETMGGGCAFFDYDNDGDQDLLLVDSDRWPWQSSDAERGRTSLYQNDGSGHFSDVTADAGFGAPFYGMGAVVGDYDGDGWTDVLVTAVGVNHLFHNEQGSFRDVAQSAGVAGSPDQWTTGGAWIDYDRDGDLDLFVCSYVRWTRELDASQDFRLVGIGRAYGPPRGFEGTYSMLFRNDAGSFADVSAAAGIRVNNPATGMPMGKSLGVSPVDLDGDGWIDLVVANDTVQNFVFLNQRDGTFQEIGARTGMAFDPLGNARGAMGIDAARFRNSSAWAVAIGNFANEMTALYVEQGRPLHFADESIATGLGPPTRQALTFGLFFFDYDLDGRLDLLTANGHLEEEINKVQVSQFYEQPPRLFWHCNPDEKTEFVPVPEVKCGADFCRPMVGRGAAFADIDGDGDLDVVITAVGGRPRLLRNDGDLANHWVRLQLVGKQANQGALGAEVTLMADGAAMYRQVMPTRSYLSQSELPVTFGLGSTAQVEHVTIRWPDGTTQQVGAVAVDRVTIIEQEP